MYPLSAILVGCSGETLLTLRRELATRKAHIEAECPDIVALGRHERSATGRTSNWNWDLSAAGPAEKRRLYIIQIKTLEELREVRWISENLNGHPVLALLDSVDKRLEPVLAMREGATQVVRLPLQPDDFQAALDHFSQNFGPAGGEAAVIAVCGITGGCGGTTVAINLAYEIAHLYKRRCLLAELSQQVGALATSLNIQPAFTTDNVFEEIERQGSYAIKKALTRFTEHLEIVAGPYKGIAQSHVRPAAVLQFVACSRRLAEVVVLDVPCSFDSLFFHTLEASDQLVLVAEQKVLSLRTLKLMRESLAGSPVRRPQHLVINRYDAKIKGFTLAELEQHLGVANLIGVRNDSAGVSAAAEEGRPLRLQSPKSPALADLDALAGILQGAGPQVPKPAGVFAQLGRAFGLG